MDNVFYKFIINTILLFEPLSSPNNEWNSITAVPLQGWLRHWITHEGWYGIKQRNQT